MAFPDRGTMNGASNVRKIDALITRRTEDRRRKAQECVSQILRAAQRNGYRISLVGSLAADRFRLHSDVDLLVHDAMGDVQRSALERLVADHFREADIPYDLIYASDLSPERVRDMLNDHV